MVLSTSAVVRPMLSIDVLGNLTATRVDQPVRLGGRRQRAVLAALVLARGQIVTFDQLVETVWGDHPPRAAVGTLHAYVSRLRRQLDPAREVGRAGSVITAVSPGYALLAAKDSVDAWRFEELVNRGTQERDANVSEALLSSALELWRGSPYAEFADEAWTQAEQVRLNELREVARDARAEARLALGQHAIIVPELEALVDATPLREERWRLLALALYRSGRQSDALSTLRRARQVLADEVGVDLGPALRTLETEVLSHTVAPGDASTPQRSVSVRQGQEGRASSTVSADALVDRDDELTELSAAVHAAIDGEARMLFLEGPAGIGKTRLLAETRRLARQHSDVRVLSARASPLEKQFGYGVVRQLLETTVRAGEEADLLAGAAAPAAAVFDLVDPAAAPSTSWLPVVHGLYWTMVNLTQSGAVVLCVDDLQWCDSASLGFLAYLARRSEGLPLLIVASVRTGESHDEDLALADLAQDPISVQLRPRPLSRAGVDVLVRSRLGEDAEEEFVTACHDATSGNPLLLRQLLRAIASERLSPDATNAATVSAIGSRAVSSLVLTRLGRLPAACVTVSQAVAVLGGSASLPMVAALADLDEASTAAALSSLARAEILRDAYPLAFVHPLVAEAVYHDVSPATRQLRHDRAARLLDAAGAAPEQAAAQLLRVAPRGDPWVVDVLQRAARRTRERAAPDAAVAMLRRALQEPPTQTARAAVLMELGQVEAISDAPAAQVHLMEAYDLQADPSTTVDLALTLARTLVFVGAPGEATRFASRAAAGLPAELFDERLALLATERISGYLHDLPSQHWRNSSPEVVGAGPGARMLAVALAWEAVIDGLDRTRAVDLVRFAVSDTTLLTTDTGLLWVIAGQVLDLCDEDSAPLWTAGLLQARRRGDLFTTLGMQLWRGWMLWGRGDLREAGQVLVAGTEMSDLWAAGGMASGYGEAFLLGVLIDRGDLGAARRYVEQIHAHVRITEGARLFGHLHARLLVAEGRHDEALTSLDAVANLMTTVQNPAWRPWRSARAAALVGLGRRAEALELVDDELELARTWGAPRVLGRTLRLRGQLRGVGGEDDLREALELLSGGRSQLELARTLLALARLTPASDSVSLLQRVTVLAGASGADALYRTAVKRLARLGVVLPPQPRAISTLSGTERRIAALHVEGVATREIAEALHLTPRSVKAALDGIRTRLNAQSLDDLRHALIDESPTEAAS